MLFYFRCKHFPSGVERGPEPFTDVQVFYGLGIPAALMTREQALELLNTWNRLGRGDYVYWLAESPPDGVQ